MSETYLCPDCGWTGSKSKLDRTGDGDDCPVCATDIRVDN